MARRKEGDSAPGDIQAQIIAGRDGKPAYAVMPVEVFLTLAILARESVQGSRKTARQTQMHKFRAVGQNRTFQKEEFVRILKLVSESCGFGENTNFMRNAETVFRHNQMEKTFRHVSDWLLSERNSTAISVGDGEEDVDVAAYDAAKARDEESFPEEVAARLIAGENPVKVFREYREWTQQELAENIGTTAPYLSQIETGRRTGSVKLLHRLADALQVEMDDLV